MSRRSLSVFRLLAIVLSIALLVPQVVLAANDTPDRAISLTAAHSSVSDSLVGSPGGVYRYYQFRYQGGSAPVQVTLTFQPVYGGGNQAFGFNLYGPSGLTFTGLPTSTPGVIQYTLAYPAAMDLLVQVYNYTNGGTVDFTLSVSGLSGGATAGVVAAGNTTPETARPLPAANATVGGTLTGAAAGAFHYYTVTYPGGDTPMAITLTATPPYTGQRPGYGFNVYRAGGAGQAVLVASGSVVAQDVHSETLSATASARSAGPYLIQVTNYWPGIAISYAVTVTGAAPPAPPATGNADAAHAIVLNSTRPGASESLAGNRAGAFDYYLVNYPGSSSPLAISLTLTSPLDGASPNAIGFNVYDGATLVATSTVSDDGTGVQSAEWRDSGTDPRAFGIQVFNYAPGTTISYLIYQVGSQ